MNDTFLLYGTTGSGKTSQLGEIAQWIFRRHGWTTRLVSADSTWAPCADMVASPSRPLGQEYTEGGVKRVVCIEAWDLKIIPSLKFINSAGQLQPQDPRPIFAELADGSWPTVTPGKTGALSVKMRRPTRHPNGGICAVSDPTFQVGGMFVEGLHTIGNMLLQDHIRNARQVGQDVVGKWTGAVSTEDSTGSKPGEMNWTASKAAPAHFGQVQDELLLQWVPRFAGFPASPAGIYVVWTSHESRGTDDKTGVKANQLGPATVGVAAVGRTAFLFGDTFHLAHANVSRVEGGKQITDVEFRAYYTGHPDQILTKLVWPAKVSTSLARLGELKRDFPGGYVLLTPERAITQYLDWKYGKEAKA